jgi:signal transduction histidine kinase
MRWRSGLQLLMALATLLVGAIAVCLWAVTGASALLAVGTVAAFSASVMGLAIGWRLANRVRRLHELALHGERMRLLGQTSGGLAHQLRNSVAGTKLAVQLHARSCDGDGESLDVAIRQLGRIEADVARFLDLGRDDVPLRPCHVVDLVDGAASLLRPQSRHADVQLCWEPPPTDPLVVGDPGRLGHIVVNLLSNAVEAAGPGGQVELTVDQTGDGSCVIEIWDSGPGPDPAVADRLFQPFVTGKSDGVGLGLFVARQAAESHGGRLEWRRDGGRTCFRVELPTAARVADETPAAVG